MASQFRVTSTTDGKVEVSVHADGSATIIVSAWHLDLTAAQYAALVEMLGGNRG